jgi:hypothetical protein
VPKKKKLETLTGMNDLVAAVRRTGVSDFQSRHIGNHLSKKSMFIEFQIILIVPKSCQKIP